MLKKSVLCVTVMLTVCKVQSQTVTDSVCFDFDIAKRIGADLIELDGHREKEPLYRATINDLKRAVSLQDSIIRNNALQLELKDDIVRLERKREKGWLKWLFGAIGFLLGIVVVN